MKMNDFPKSLGQKRAHSAFYMAECSIFICVLSILIFIDSKAFFFPHISSMRYILDTMKSSLASSELISLANVQPFNNFNN